MEGVGGWKRSWWGTHAPQFSPLGLRGHGGYREGGTEQSWGPGWACRPGVGDVAAQNPWDRGPKWGTDIDMSWCAGQADVATDMKASVGMNSVFGPWTFILCWFFDGLCWWQSCVHSIPGSCSPHWTLSLGPQLLFLSQHLYLPCLGSISGRRWGVRKQGAWLPPLWAPLHSCLHRVEPCVQVLSPAAASVGCFPRQHAS